MVQDAKGRAKPTLAHFMPPGLSSIEAARQDRDEIRKMVENMKVELAECNVKFEELRRRGPCRKSDGMPLGKEADELCLAMGKLNQEIALFRGRAPTMAAGVKRWRAARRKVLEEKGIFDEVLYGDDSDQVAVTDSSSEVSENFSVDEAVLKNNPFWGLSGGT